MASVIEIMQLCRLCLEKDEVNTPIFEGQSDRQIFLKISACLPVKVSKEDKLPKNICDGCSCKLEMLYQFWNTSANAEKKLIRWLDQIGTDKLSDKEEAAVALQSQHSISSDPVVLKQEVVDVADNQSTGDDLVPDDLNVSNDSQEYLLQQEQLPYQPVEFQFQQDGFDAETADDNLSQNVESEPLPKQRKRRAAAMKALPAMDSEDEDDPDLINTKIAKTEEQSEESGGEDMTEPTTFVGVPSADDDEQPGPSGVGKASGDAPCLDEGSILRRLIIGPSMTVTVANPSTITRDVSEFKVSPESPPLKIRIKLENENVYLEESFGDDNAEKPVEESNERVHCDVCDETFKNSISFALHSIKHSSNKRYTCHMCSYTSRSKYHFEMHVRAHEGSTAYKCKICNKAFTVSTHALEHKNLHTGEKPFQCDICGKSFTFSWFLTSHRRTQHWEIITGMPLVKYDCTICNKHYTSSTGLKRHKLSRHNEGGVNVSVLCDICGKLLSNKEKLKFHRRIHTGYKPFSCTVCHKCFSRKEQLKEHERVHTGEKPYICKQCGKGFTQRSPLRIHQRTHTGERPYICRLCNKGFISKGVMGTHMKTCNIVNNRKN